MVNLLEEKQMAHGGVLYKFEDQPRHPSQLYEAFFEGLIIFVILLIFLKVN